MRKNRRILIIFSAAVILAFLLAARIFLDYIYRLPVLMYHSINYTRDKANRMTISPEIFEKQMKFLRERDYNVILLKDAVSYIKAKKNPPPKTVAITIDDGYEDNYTYAYPVLKKYKIPATIFVIVDLVGKENFLNWDEIKKMQASGIIDIESHTRSHPFLTGIGDSKLKYELVSSKMILEERLGKQVDFLCYPMGVYDERVKSAARLAGYRAAFATKPTMISPNYDIYEIKRVRISPNANNLISFALKISGYHAFLRVIQNDYKDIPYILWKKRY